VIGTMLGLFFTPLFFVMVERLAAKRKPEKKQPPTASKTGAPPHE